MKITKATQIDKNKIVLDGCMVTYSGIVFDLMNPDPDLICLEDIAHGLAHTCRWNGATKKYYSVAEHSMRVANRCIGTKMKISAMLHDAEEAYWGDMIKPLKNIIDAGYPSIIQRIRKLRFLIFKKFDLEYIDVSKEDNDELNWDFDNLILKTPEYTMDPETAENAWKYRFELLMHKLQCGEEDDDTRYNLWNYMQEQHGLLLLEDELAEIRTLVKKDFDFPT